MKAVDPETHYPIVSLHRQMFLWSALLFVSVVAMFWVDYDREWKQWQVKFLTKEHDRVGNAKKEFEAKNDPEMTRLEAELGKAEDALKSQQDEIDKNQKEADKQEALRFRVNASFLDADQQVKSAKFFYDEAISEGGSGAKQFEKLDEWTKKLNSLRIEVEKATADRDAAINKRKDIEKPARDLKEKIDDLHLKLSKLDKQLQTTDNAYWANRVRRIPFVEMLNPDIKIRQVQINTLTDNIYFAEVPHVDRCMTCHMAIDKPEGYDQEVNPLRSHPRLDLYVGANSKHPMDKFGCTSCHSGSGRSCTFTTANHTPSVFDRHEETAAKWKKEYAWQEMEHWDDPQLPKDLLTSACYKCHKQEIELEGAGAWNEGRKVFERAGCFACHRTQGFETMRRPGPSLYHIADKVTPAWAFRWILEPTKVRPDTRMPRLFGHNPDQKDVDGRDKAEVQALVEYLFAASEPLGDGAPPIAQEKGNVENGKKITEAVGCRACHSFEKRPEGAFVYNPDLIPSDLRKKLVEKEPEIEGFTFQTAFGPVLEGVGSKIINYSWAWHWVKDPKHYFPETRMPDLRLTDQEAADVAAYLMSLKDQANDFSPPLPERKELHNAAWEYLRVKHSLAEVGDELNLDGTASYRDLLAQDFFSNQVLAATSAGDLRLAGAVTGPALDKAHGRLSLMAKEGVWKDAGAKFDEVVTTPLREQDKLDDETMRKLEPGLKRAKQILTEWSEKLAGAEVGQRERLYLGDKMVNRYGCFSCHAIRGYEMTTPIGRDFTGQDGIGSKDLVQIDFGYTLREENKPHIEKDRWQWMDLKIHNPRIFDQGHDKQGDERLKMPLFNLSDEERHHLVVFLASLVKTDVPVGMQKRLDPNELAMERGKQLVREKNCAACHRLSLDRMEVKTEKESWTTVEGLYNGIDEDDQSRNMLVWTPNADLDKGPGDKVSVDPKEAHDDVRGLGGDIVEEYLGRWKKEKGGKRIEVLSDVRGVAPPILVGEGKKVRPEWLFGFLKKPIPLRGFLKLRTASAAKTDGDELMVRMPTFGLSDDEATDLVRWFSLRDGERWPYESVEPPKEADSAEVKAAHEMFDSKAIACISCHVVTGQPGSGGEKKAPDLNLAKERLKPQWIRRWLEDPGLMQPGTAMPKFPWGPGTGFKGTAEEQMNNMVDYLRNLSAK